jgi:hypothetical protein
MSYRIYYTHKLEKIIYKRNIVGIITFTLEPEIMSKPECSTQSSSDNQKTKFVQTFVRKFATFLILMSGCIVGSYNDI